MKMRWIVPSVLLSVAAVGTALADPPGFSSAFGKSLGDWMKLYAIWNFGGDQADHEGKMIFVPDVNQAPAGDWNYDEPTNTWNYVTEMDLRLHPGDKFCAPLFYYYGWEYEDGSIDDPNDAYWLGVLTGARIELTLDGEVLVDSDASDYMDNWFDPVYFGDALLFDQTNEYGAVGIAYVQGFGYAHQPLSKGTHTLVWSLHMDEFDPNWDEEYAIGNQVTWHITVAK